MTHDELLNRVVYEEGTRYEWRNALRAVVELHRPYVDHITYCKDCERIYPCLTIRAIEKELI